MSALEWYPRNSAKALEGMRRLTLEQRGAYNTLLDLIYSRGAPVPDDDRWLAGNMNVSVRKWLIIRAELLAAGRIVAREDRHGPVLSDEMAEIEIEKQTSRRRVNAESGKIGGEKSAKRTSAFNENKDLDRANAAATAQAPLKLETEEIEKKESEANASVAQAPRKKPRATRRCPTDWSPSPEFLSRLAEEGFSPADIEREVANIRDHPFKTPRTDWDATARTWFRNATPRGDRYGQPPGRAPTSPTDARRANTESRRGAWARVIGGDPAVDAAPPYDDGGGDRAGGDMPRLRLVSGPGPAGDGRRDD